METNFANVVEAMTYLEGVDIADHFRINVDGAIAAYLSSGEGSEQTAIIYEGVNGVTVEYLIYHVFA